MDIKDRIKQIMEHEQLTAAALAESIGVSQGTISHTLGDRNKYPSTDFIIKLHERFSYISLDWLLTGKGEMVENEDLIPSNSEIQDLFGSKNLKNPGDYANDLEKRKEMPLETPVYNSKEIVKQEVIYKEVPSKKITEIRVFFDDNTYQIFKPEK